MTNLSNLKLINFNSEEIKEKIEKTLVYCEELHTKYLKNKNKHYYDYNYNKLLKLGVEQTKKTHEKKVENFVKIWCLIFDVMMEEHTLYINTKQSYREKEDIYDIFHYDYGNLNLDKSRKLLDLKTIKEINFFRIGSFDELPLSVYFKCLNKLGYNSGEVSNNLEIIDIMEKFFNILPNQILLLRKSLDKSSNIKNSEIAKYPEVIAYYSDELFKKSIFANELVEYFEKNTIDEKSKALLYIKIIPSVLYFNNEQMLSIKNLIIKDLNKKVIYEQLKKSKNKIINTFLDHTLGENTISLNNMINSNYSVSVMFDYNKVRYNFPKENRSDVTNVLDKIIRKTDYSIGIKNEGVVILIVKTNFPIESKKLSVFLEENFSKWVFDDFDFNEEMHKFINLQREENLNKSLENKDSVKIHKKKI